VARPSLPPYNVGDLEGAERRHAPAAARNVGPIGDVLAEWLPTEGTVLEVASGTGEHALAFAKRFPRVRWVPSDPDPLALRSIKAWADKRQQNLAEPIELDARDPTWPVPAADAVVSINLVHIAPWDAALGLLDGAARILPVGGRLILYGPWRVTGEVLAPSNEAFDRDLRSRDPRWGLRDTATFEAQAAARGLVAVDRRSMPANNLMLLFRRA
jgi:SAM-dependent methyltransferase